jgi:hypothetical protein
MRPRRRTFPHLIPGDRNVAVGLVRFVRTQNQSDRPRHLGRRASWTKHELEIGPSGACSPLIASVRFVMGSECCGEGCGRSSDPSSDDRPPLVAIARLVIGSRRQPERRADAIHGERSGA